MSDQNLDLAQKELSPELPEEVRARVSGEQLDLSDKIVKLTTFLNSPFVMSLHKKQRDLMESQLDVMVRYNKILLYRLNPGLYVLRRTMLDGIAD